jgi:hypothetical protein
MQHSFFQNVAIAMAQVFHFDEFSNRILTGLTLAETRELEELERRVPSLAEWDAYTMQPVSDHEKRWAYLSQKHIEAMVRAADASDQSVNRRRRP